jgi:hypothetical protein
MLSHRTPPLPSQSPHNIPPPLPLRARPLHKHLSVPSLLALQPFPPPLRPPPLIQHNADLHARIIHNGIHFDVVPVVAEGVLELDADAFDAVEGEHDEGYDGDGEPAHGVDEREGEDAAEEGEDLFLVDTRSY